MHRDALYSMMSSNCCGWRKVSLNRSTVLLLEKGFCLAVSKYFSFDFFINFDHLSYSK
jgi:hypothetical protein